VPLTGRAESCTKRSRPKRHHNPARQPALRQENGPAIFPERSDKGTQTAKLRFSVVLPPSWQGLDFESEVDRSGRQLDNLVQNLTATIILREDLCL
jgi:hypothetical protein